MTRRLGLAAALTAALALAPFGAGAQTEVKNKTLGGPNSGATVPTTPPGKAGTVKPAANPAPAGMPAAAAQPAMAGGTTAPANTPATTASPATGPAQTGQKIAAPAQPVPAQPIPEGSLLQAVYQNDGVFTEMYRPNAGMGGQIQEAWDVSDEREGIYQVPLCETCVYKIRTREMMTTTIILPDDAAILSADLGDPTGFKVQVRDGNKLAVRPATYGVDTNLNVYTKGGLVYAFYLRAEKYNSLHVPDLVVRVQGREKPALIEAPKPPAPPPQPGSAEAADELRKAAVHDLTMPKPKSGDFVRNAEFDPSKLHGWNDYKLWGDDELAPKMVYRDDFFTYIQYGEKWDGMELSSAYVTVDEIDELVNTRVQGSTFIIESVSPLITLKNGKKFLCIKYIGRTP